MLKVFLVEDEFVIREGLKANIPWEQYGYEFVGEASDGEMALPLIRAAKPDVLITDIKMPFMDGLSLSKIVSSEFPKIKIVIISGYDDFEYARQAIEVGAIQYLLKPITKMTLRKTMLEMKEKIEQESEQRDWQQQFGNEMHEYEQFARRRFFEKLLQAEMAVKDIYEEAARLSLEISAESYNLIFFSIRPKNMEGMPGETDWFMAEQDKILYFILRHPQYILFSWNVNCWGVLVKSESVHVEELTDRCLNHIRQICSPQDARLEWYVAVSRPIERLSMLHECYQKVSHYIAYRFIVPGMHILTESTLADYLSVTEEKKIGHVNPSSVDPEIIKDFLRKGSFMEIHDFADSYLQSFQDALRSRMFLDYMILSIRYTITAYLDALGIAQDSYNDRIDEYLSGLSLNSETIGEYFVFLLGIAVELRDQKSDVQSGRILRKAQEYIDVNFSNESLSLNEVAKEVGVSANYLSAIFSQNMQKTFIEYVTGKRMDRARYLLNTTDRSSGDIAAEVGYKDPHYFSFVFKKTQGLSPREYRTGKRAKKNG
ncbi:response regulator [bacterium C-53]|nr:response regulator [Lachnospiraceae bacterium]NBI02708.1 response regulator [Lachnospiraceae bacterium]RKJ11343.1 response regulator [bacterium C-53]